MTLLGFGVCVCGFLRTERSTVMVSCGAAWDPSPPPPQSCRAWGMLSALAASALCCCFDGFNEDVQSSHSVHSARAGRLKVEVAFPRINPHFQKWLVSPPQLMATSG